MGSLAIPFYLSRPRWIYLWRPCIQKSIPVQAAKLVVLCDYFLYSHVLDRRSEDCQSVTCTAPLGQKNWKRATLLLSTFLYSTSFLFLSFYLGLFYFYIFLFFHSCVLSYLSHPCVSFSFEADVFHLYVLKTTTCQTRQRKKKRATERRVGCQSHPCRRRDELMQTEKYVG